MTELHLTKTNVCITPFFCHILYTVGQPKSTTDDYCCGHCAIILAIIVGIISFPLGMFVMYAVLKWKKNRNRTVSINEPDVESTSFTNSVIADDDNNKLQMQGLEYDD